MVDIIEYFSMEDSPYGIFQYEELLKSDDIYRPSFRDFHVLFWIKKGKGKYILDFKEYDFEPHSIHLISKDQLHYFNPFDRDRTDICSIVFTPDFIYKSDYDIRHLFAFTGGLLKQELKNSTVLSLEEENSWSFLFNEMHNLYKSNDKSADTLFYHYLNILLIKYENLMELTNSTIRTASYQNKEILEFTEVLEKNFNKEFNVGFYAQELKMSVKSLQNLTREFYKHPPKELIHERRILEIKRLLKGSDKSGKMIARELNFSESTHMFKYFKKHTGMTPLEFRNSS